MDPTKTPQRYKNDDHVVVDVGPTELIDDDDADNNVVGGMGRCQLR